MSVCHKSILLYGVKLNNDEFLKLKSYCNDEQVMLLYDNEEYSLDTICDCYDSNYMYAGITISSCDDKWDEEYDVDEIKEKLDMIRDEYAHKLSMMPHFIKIFIMPKEPKIFLINHMY